MFNSYQWNHLPKITFSYCLLIYEKDLCLVFTYSALPLSLYIRDWIKMTVLFPRRMALEAVNPWNDVKAPRKTGMQKAISIVQNGLLAGLQNSDINSFWPQKACFCVTEEQVLSRNTRITNLLSVECKLLKAACLQPAFRKNSGSFVFTEEYQTPRYLLGQKCVCWENKGPASATGKYYTDAFRNCGRIFVTCYAVLYTINSSFFCYKLLFLL